MTDYNIIWQIMTWHIKTDYDRFWQIMTDYNRLWQTIIDFDRLWQIMADYEKLCQIMKSYDRNMTDHDRSVNLVQFSPWKNHQVVSVWLYSPKGTRLLAVCIIWVIITWVDYFSEIERVAHPQLSLINRLYLWNILESSGTFYNHLKL